MPFQHSGGDEPHVELSPFIIHPFQRASEPPAKARGCHFGGRYGAAYVTPSAGDLPLALDPHPNQLWDRIPSVFGAERVGRPDFLMPSHQRSRGKAEFHGRRGQVQSHVKASAADAGRNGLAS